MLLLGEIFPFNGWTKILFKSILKSRIFTNHGQHQIFTSCFWEGHSNSWLLLLKSTFPKVFDAFCKNLSKGIVRGGLLSPRPPPASHRLWAEPKISCTTPRGWKLDLILNILGQKPQCLPWNGNAALQYSRNLHWQKSQLLSEGKNRKIWVSAVKITYIICLF